MPASPAVATRFERELLERVDDVARAEHRTRSNLLQRAALLYVEHAERGPEDAEPKAAA
jgi:predicted transcriptional regulator